MKTKIQIKSIFGSVLFEYEREDNTVAKTISEAIKNYADLRYADLSSADLRYADLRYANLRYADLRCANLSYADLSYADLRHANLRYADLSYADLRYADLRYADLSSADLRYADLRYAKTDKRYIQVGCIGSVGRLTTYCFDDDIVWSGCFKGSLDEFLKQVKKTHVNNDKCLREYVGFVKYVKSLK